MEDQLFKIPPFECENVPLSELRSKWFDYKKQFEYVAEALSRKKKKKLKNIFLAVGGRQLQRVFESLPVDVNAAENEDEFSAVIRRLDAYFAPKRHDTFERYSFWSLKPSVGEALDKFLLRAKTLASKCQFGSTEGESRDAAVIDKVVMLAPPELRRKILEKSDINLDDLTKLVNSHLSVQQQVRELNQHTNGSGNVLDVIREGAYVNKVGDNTSADRKNQWAPYRADTECGKCGNLPHRSEDLCPAKNMKCRICNYYGHFAKKCRTDPKNRKAMQSMPVKRKLEDYPNRPEPRRPKLSRVSAVGEQSPGDDAVNHDKSDSFIYAISDNHDEIVWCKVGQVLVEMMIDSGSKFNIIDELTWNFMKGKNAIIKNVRPSDKQLSAYAQRGKLEIMCVFDAEIRVVDGSGEPLEANFYVVKGGEQNLLGRDTAKLLGVLLIGLPSVAEVQESVQHIANSTIEKFPTIKGMV